MNQENHHSQAYKPLEWFVSAVIFLLPLFVFPWLRQPIVGAKQFFLYASFLIGLLVWAGSLFYKNKITIKLPAGGGWLWLMIAWGGVSWFLTSRGVKTRSLIDANPWSTILAISAFGLIFSQTKLAKNKERLLTIISLSAGLLVIISIALFLIPETKYPLRIFANYSLLIIPNARWSPIGSNLGLLLFILPLLAFWLKKLTGRINQRMTGEKMISLPALFVFFFIIGTIISFYQLIKNQPPILDLYSSWVIAVETLKKTPLFGLGPGNFLTGFSLYRPLEFNAGKNWAVIFTDPINLWFHIWTELGLAALAAWIIFCWKTISSLGKKRNSLHYPLLILLLIQIISPTNLPILFLFLILAIASLERKKFTLPNSKESGRIIIGAAIIFTLPLGFILFKTVKGEYLFVQSLRAINDNNGGEAYRLQREAVIQNPWLINYRLSRSQTDLALANAIAKKGKKMTDNDRKNVSSLIQEAINESKAATALEPQNIIAWKNLSQIYGRLINLAKQADTWAISSYQQAISLDPLDPTLRVNLGGILYGLKKYDRASQSFQTAVRLKPDNANAWYNLAWSLKKQNNLQSAVEALQQAVALVPGNSPDYDKAKKELESWQKELGKKAKKSPAKQKNNQLSVPTPIPSPKIKPIELPKEAAPQIQTTPSPSQTLPSPTANPTPEASPTAGQ